MNEKERIAALVRKVVFEDEPAVDFAKVDVRVSEVAPGRMTVSAHQGRFQIVDHPRAVPAFEAAMNALLLEDTELKGIRLCWEVLQQLDADARTRVLTYLQTRVDAEAQAKAAMLPAFTREAVEAKARRSPPF